MKINISKLNLKQEPLHATDTEIIYQQPQSQLEKTWNNLSLHFQKLEQENENYSEKQLYNRYMQSKYELETNLEIYKLIKNNVIENKVIKSSKKENLYSIKKVLANDLTKICEDKILLLQNAIENEKCIYQIIKNENFCFFENKMRIFIDHFYFIEVRNNKLIYNKNYKPKGLFVIIEHKKFIFRGFVNEESNDEIENVKRYIKEINLVGEYNICNIKITIKQGNEESNNKKICKDANLFENTTLSNNANEKNKMYDEMSQNNIIINHELKLCKFIINYIKENKNLLGEMIICYVSKYFLNFIFKEKCIENINLDEIILIDNLSKIYCCIYKDKIVKVIRENNDFNIFVDEKKVNFAT
ncbi:hypothetical protein GVAV_000016 [Gurleya vavrai]